MGEAKRKKAAAQKQKKRSNIIAASIMAAAVIIAVVVILVVSNKGKEGMRHVEIEVEGYGTIAVELDGNTAPKTVQNFIELAESGFYDGLTFHRVQSGFMIQGGDPKADGTGGSPEKIVGEFSANGVKNNLSHKRGAISMARRGDSYNSASSQFFIVHEDCPSLDGQYAVFGYVTKGMDVVDEICEDSEGWNRDSSYVITNKADQPVIKTIKVID